ncbi:Polycystic kidney disease 1 like 1, partial [Araneus ventricosus]
IPLQNEWFAKVVPFSYGNIFIWSLPESDEIISADFKLVIHRIPPGTNELKVTVKNSYGHLNASMLVQAAVTLIALNYSFSDFFVGQNGTFSVTVNQPVLPDAVFVDFGDGHNFDSSVNPSILLFESHGNSSTFTITHMYQTTGLHIVYFNASNSVSHFEHWTTVDVAIPIYGVKLELLSPSIVALFEEVVVQCLVENGSEIDFDWDFGDDTDGQYTTVNSTDNSSIAIHSYGVADTYNITVHVYNDYETVTAHLNVSIQAVEPIEKLHLRPRLDQYAAALHEQKSDQATGSSKYATDSIMFEAWVWRGSDIQFLFDFGDGQIKLVPSELNVWSLPCATVKHIYIAEGIYNISVTATNPLDSINQNLPQPFYVQFAPKGLKLDKQYYIIQHKHALRILASVTQGTNISFAWMLDNEQLNETGRNLLLDSLRPGVHIVSVEVFNKVTDFAYKTVTRPSVSSKIYVQEKLRELGLCVLHNGEEWCQEDELELPLDEEIVFVAKVLPSTERSLRFTWQVGMGDLRRTNKPFLHYMYPSPGRFIVNVTAQNHISMASSPHLELHLIQKIANLTSIHCQGPNLVNHVITFRAMYWFGTNLTFRWDFGDGSPIKTTHSPSIHHVYKEVGEYWVSVNVWNKFSHANISTNMFFLHHFCQKPEITFLQQIGQVYNYADDILIETEISTNCETNNVKYSWTIEKENKSLVLFNVPDMLLQRHLIIPRNYLKPGKYNIHLRVEMSGFIVYAESSTRLEIQFPNPVAFIKGGYVRLIGSSDNIKLETNVITLENASQSTNYSWSCLPLNQRHLSCFQAKYLDYFSSTFANSFILSASHLTPGLSAVIINSTMQGLQLVSASQAIEIMPTQHVLITMINSEVGHDHRINQDSKIRMKADCQNCSGRHIEYEWKVWKIEGEMHKMHYSNYECVQADGSTFFIMSPNSTLISENSSYSFHDFFQDNLKEPHYGSTNQLINEDLPPFPNLPGFPEELNFSHSRKRLRSVRDSPHESMIDPPDFTPFHSYPFEENARYDVNSTFFNLSYPDLLPVPSHDDVLGSLDFPIPEEGAPGESGSAIARDQSSHRFKMYLSENEDDILVNHQIEEGAGPPRIDGNHVFVHETDKMGDPVRDPRLHEISTVTHLLNRPRTPISLSSDNTTTGFNSEYFTLKPGVLRAGHSYLIQVITKDKNHAFEGGAMELLLINAGPVNGRCTLMPIKGYSLNFNFRLHCMEWKSDHQPLYYELRYSLTPDEPGHLIYFGLNRNAKFVLPSGLDSESSNVYLNVIIRNNVGASTKVCSIVREVKPLHLNTTLIQYVYNETFHPQSQLAKYLGEKQNQALLHQIHVLSSSLNNQGLVKTTNNKDKILKEQIRFRFLEAIEHLKILSKVEAIQILSCLSEIITDTSEITMFELQKVYNIYSKLHNHQSELYGFTSEVLQHEFLVLLSKLMFASHSVYLRNEELIRIGRQQLAEEIKDMMKLRLKIEDPLIIEIPHIFICGLYLLNLRQKLGSNTFLIPLKLTEVQFLGGFNSSVKDKRMRRCLRGDCIDDDSCISVIAQEFDYVSMPHYLNFAQLLPSKKTSVLLSVLSCDKLESLETTTDLNFRIRFSRNHKNEMTNRALLSVHHMNFHQINITDDDINHSYLFHVKLDSRINGSENFQLEALFRCSALEITAYSIPFPANIFQVPLKDLMEPYFNFVPVAIFIVILLIYITLLVLNFYKDKMKNISCSPVPLLDNDNKHKQLYLVCVKTGMYYSAGTTASVFVVLHGTKGMTETRQLIDSKAEKFYFQKGAVDLFLMSTEKHLGPLVKLEVWHNNHGPSPSWYLKGIIIKDLKTGLSYDFECYKWLSAEKGDGQIERELTVSERKPLFCSVFWDSFITLIHDFNMWNSVICESPTSFFTGVQRLSCCLCFYLNCSLLFAVLLEQIFEKQPVQENAFPHISESTFPLCLLASAVATLPQIILTLLFRFSKTPSVSVDPKFSKVFCFLSLHHLYCWLRQKRSNSSHSSDRSASSLGESDSFYSSFEESSVMSIPELMEESFSTEGKDEFPTSISSMSINDPVSPLQKTLSTWQAFENWVRKKHDLIKSDVMSGRQQISTEKSDSVLIPEEIMLEDLEHNEDLSDSTSISSENSGQRLEITNFIHNDAALGRGLNLHLHLPFLHSSFYYVAWFLLASNIMVAGTITAIKISSFSFTKCTFWIKYTFLSQLCSFMIIIPSLVLSIAIMISMKKYFGRKIPRQLVSTDQTLQDTDTNEMSKVEPSYKRIEYFKKYLRPPKEQILEQFRQYAMKEKYIFNLQSSFWQYVAIFILLLLLLLPSDGRNRYLQKTSILNSLFRRYGLSVAATPIKSSLELYDWLEFDFIDRFYGRNQCLDPNLDCAITFLTGCSLVGSAVVRLFKTPACVDGLFSACKDYSPGNVNSNNACHQYEHRLLKGHFGVYDLEDKLVILPENPEEAQQQIDLFLSHLFNISSGAISIEFLLFNPTFSTLTSVSLLFELTELEILFSKEILSAKLHEPASFQYHSSFALHLLFLLIVLVKYKNTCWRILKYGFSSLIKSWDCLSALFNVISTVYISVYIIYMLQFRHILSTLAEKNFDVNLNIATTAYFETLSQQLLSFLIFLHLIGSIRILSFSPRLKKLLQIITKSWKIILSTFLIFILLISICDLMTRHFIGVTDKLSHPLTNCIKGMGSIFKYYKKPEVVNSDSTINKAFSTVILFAIVAIHVVLLSFLRSILIKNKSYGQRILSEKITLKDTKKVLKRKLTGCFKPPSPHVVAKDDYVLPVDFLLIELEQLADTLLSKANNLFSEYEINDCKKLEDTICSSTIEGYLNSQCQFLENEIGFEIPSSDEIKVDDAFDQYSPKISAEFQMKIAELVAERLTATMPRSSKSTTKNLQPSSLSASISSQRKFKHFSGKNLNLSSSLPHKIRKTYPLYHVDSDSSSFSDSSSDKNVGNSLRKTKSRGKGKNKELNIADLDEDML